MYVCDDDDDDDDGDDDDDDDGDVFDDDDDDDDDGVYNDDDDDDKDGNADDDYNTHTRTVGAIISGSLIVPSNSSVCLHWMRLGTTAIWRRSLYLFGKHVPRYDDDDDNDG